jgi:adenylosuccinate synthase
MPVSVVIGAQWGDEGKGKIVDLISEDVDIVARYQGGANAGHTICWEDKTFVLHLVPSGIFQRDVQCVIGNGVVIDPVALMEEIEMIQDLGFNPEGRLWVSGNAHLILPYHKALDKARERYLDEGAIGTTGRGIGPAYQDKFGRCGIRVIDLLNLDQFEKKLRAATAEKNALLQTIYNAEPLDVDKMLDEFSAFNSILKPYITDTVHYLNQALDDGKQILAEGAQGSLLDIDFGTYPYVTSSHPTAGGCCTGLGVPPTQIDRVIGIVKAYSTRVGNGPFPTELNTPIGERLRETGQEYGATTGRPRRCGWLDLVGLKYTVAINGMTELAITKLDVLTGLDQLLVATKYQRAGKRLSHFPSELSALESAEPMYRTCKGWSEDLSSAHEFDSLPLAAQNYLYFIEEQLDVPIRYISTGPKRSETIVR